MAPLCSQARSPNQQQCRKPASRLGHINHPVREDDLALAALKVSQAHRRRERGELVVQIVIDLLFERLRLREWEWCAFRERSQCRTLPPYAASLDPQSRVLFARLGQESR